MRSALFFVFFLSLSLGTAFGADETVWKATDTYKVMNFVVLFAILIFLLRKPAAAFLNSRVENISKNLKDLEERKLSVEKELEEYREKLEAMDAQAAEILVQYREQAEAARLRVLAETEASIEKMREQAKRNMAYEFERSRSDLQYELVDKALLRAEALIREKISDEDHKRLTEEYLEKVVAS